MPMPKATMDKDYSPVFRQHKVRTSRQGALMEAVAKSQGKQAFPDRIFRFGILAANARHAVTTLLWREDIRHGFPFYSQHTIGVARLPVEFLLESSQFAVI